MGRATATVWFTFLFLPIFPLSRYGLLSPGRDDFEPRISFGQVLQGISPYICLTSYYQVTERLPLSGAEILNTYLYAYIWLPLKLFIPLGVIIIAARLAVSGAEDGSTTPVLVYGLLSMIWLGYVLFVLSSQLHRTRGGVE